MELEALLKASESGVVEVIHGVEELGRNIDFAEGLETKVDEDEKALKVSLKHIMYLEDQITEQTGLLHAKKAQETIHHERAPRLKNQMADLFGDFSQCKA